MDCDMEPCQKVFFNLENLNSSPGLVVANCCFCHLIPLSISFFFVVWKWAYLCGFVDYSTAFLKMLCKVKSAINTNTKYYYFLHSFP